MLKKLSGTFLGRGSVSESTGFPIVELKSLVFLQLNIITKEK